MDCIRLHRLSVSHRVVELEEGAVLPEGVRVGNLDTEARGNLVRPPAPAFLNQVARDLDFSRGMYAKRVGKDTWDYTCTQGVLILVAQVWKDTGGCFVVCIPPCYRVAVAKPVAPCLQQFLHSSVEVA